MNCTQRQTIAVSEGEESGR